MLTPGWQQVNTETSHSSCTKTDFPDSGAWWALDSYKDSPRKVVCLLGLVSCQPQFLADALEPHEGLLSCLSVRKCVLPPRCSIHVVLLLLIPFLLLAAEVEMWPQLHQVCILHTTLFLPILFTFTLSLCCFPSYLF